MWKRAFIRLNSNTQIRISLYFPSYLWGFKRIICRKMNIKEKDSSFVHWFWGTKDCRIPFVKIVTFRSSAAKTAKNISVTRQGAAIIRHFNDLQLVTTVKSDSKDNRQMFPHVSCKNGALPVSWMFLFSSRAPLTRWREKSSFWCLFGLTFSNSLRTC